MSDPKPCAMPEKAGLYWIKWATPTRDGWETEWLLALVDPASSYPIEAVLGSDEIFMWSGGRSGRMVVECRPGPEWPK